MCVHRDYWWNKSAQVKLGVTQSKLRNPCTSRGHAFTLSRLSFLMPNKRTKHPRSINYARMMTILARVHTWSLPSPLLGWNPDPWTWYHDSWRISMDSFTKIKSVIQISLAFRLSLYKKNKKACSCFQDFITIQDFIIETHAHARFRTQTIILGILRKSAILGDHPLRGKMPKISA